MSETDFIRGDNMKKLILFMSVLMFITLSGCGNKAKAMIDKAIVSQAGISDDDYKKYLEQQEGKVTDIEDINETELPSGAIHVSFFKNANIKVRYFLDAQCTLEIDPELCYIDPGESIYASVTEINNPHSSLYDLKGFRVCRYTDEGERYTVDNETDDKNLVISVPEDATYTELSVEPLGYYPSRQLSFDDVVFENGGIKADANGIWYIDNNKCDSDEMEISSSVSFAVSYEFDKDKYYFLASVPNAYYHSDEDGKVIFAEQNDVSSTDDYVVDLHKYISADIESAKGLNDLKINGETVFKDNTIDEERLKKLKCGDVLEFTTSKDYTAVCDELDSIRTDIAEGYCFKYTIPQEPELSYSFTVRKWLEKDKVSFDVKESSIWQKFISITPLGKEDEDELLKVSNGQERFTYRDLKNGKDIPLKEINNLKIYATDSIEKYKNLVFKVSVNGKTPEYIMNKSDSITLKFSEVDTVKIDVCKGFVFNKKEIVNDFKGLQLHYYANGNEITDGQFLEEGTEVTIKAACDEGVTITGGAIKAGALEGTVVIKESTKIKDLVVNAESDGSFVFNSADYNYDHGKIRFLYQGDEIAEGQRIGKGSEITYEAASVDNGYWLPNGDHKIIVEGEDQAKTAMKAIKFYKHEKRDVKLVYPEYGGKIIYSADVPISADTHVSLYCGTEIKMAFEAWNGWQVDYPDGTKYVVTEEENQVININGKTIDSTVFKETKGNKPTLEIKLDSSVGKSTKFSVSACGAETVQNVKMDDYFDKTIFDKKIGTEKPFTISADGGALANGKRLKLKIEFTYIDQNNNKMKVDAIRYIDKLPGSTDVKIFDYEEERTDKSCEKITIEIVKE